MWKPYEKSEGKKQSDPPIWNRLSSVKTTPVSYYSYPTCSHFRDKIKVGTGTLLLSEYRYNNDISKEPVPDLGIYLAESWDRLFNIITVRGKPQHFEMLQEASLLYPYLIVEWSDGQSLPEKQLSILVNGIISNLHEGKKVEIGCMGGHGRTGTLAACVIGKEMGWNARETIKYLRDTYCDEAVETRVQIEAVDDFLGMVLSDEEVLKLVPLKSYMMPVTSKSIPKLSLTEFE
jgi:hypothetical protein